MRSYFSQIARRKIRAFVPANAPMRNDASSCKTGLDPLYLISLIVLILFGCFSSKVRAEPLPLLGDPVSAIISPEKEQAIGESLLRMLQSSASIIHDPLLNEYVEGLVYRLASVSGLENPELNIVVINAADINAFAMPGGILGINAGLFIYSENEAELAAVIAHELAHLKQRHFARSVEKLDRTKWATLTALFASIALIAATGEGDAGIAALATTQAVSFDSQLKFSRQNEREADRIGMQTLVEAGFNPYAMPHFFERLTRAQRFSTDMPYEFLRTHPVTQSRIADSVARAEQLPVPTKLNSSLEYKLMRSRVLAAYATTSSQAIADFRAQINQEAKKQTDPALYYGLARAYMRDRQFIRAENILERLLEKDATRITYIVTYAESLTKQKKYPQAASILETALSINPGNYSLSMSLAKALIHQQKGEPAVKLLQDVLARKPKIPNAWKLLSEAYSLTENKVGIHMAEAEAQFLRGQNDRAIEQLKFALALVPNTNLPMTKKIETRIRDFISAKKRISL